MKIAVFWFRRDLRLEDNVGLFNALTSDRPVLPLFIFDQEILSSLPKDDPRVGFIHESLGSIHKKLSSVGSTLLVKNGSPKEIWTELLEEFEIEAVYTNHDYEPYAINRDAEIRQFLEAKGVEFHTFKDQVIFEKSDVLKDDGKPYTVYTPFKNKWLSRVQPDSYESVVSENHLNNFMKSSFGFPSLGEIGFEPSSIKVKPFNLEAMTGYEDKRDIPAMEATSYLSPHLRFGTVSVRKLAKEASQRNQVFLSELIWREFFMQILYHFPKVVDQSFKSQYDHIEWEKNENHFKKWCDGKTGYPMVDAGMRELNETGYMHNRVRMVVASFLTKHLLLDWRWGEAYFAEKLLDYELASNNGNWQWAAGTGCDAAPYFRVFNPTSQLKKFDPQMKYCKKWLGADIGKYPPIVDHAAARQRALDRYKAGLERT
ncbi:MAG: deoxyribodipyrimidine photo-lyase [Cyclobacteriaceae bacterium]